jgi:hypothetical protein
MTLKIWEKWKKVNYLAASNEVLVYSRGVKFRSLRCHFVAFGKLKPLPSAA